MTSGVSSFSKVFSFLHKTPSLKPADLQSVWRKYLRETTEKIAGADPGKAKIICLGDVHD
jgi:hypothetical protein